MILKKPPFGGLRGQADTYVPHEGELRATRRPPAELFSSLGGLSSESFPCAQPLPGVSERRTARRRRVCGRRYCGESESAPMGASFSLRRGSEFRSSSSLPSFGGEHRVGAGPEGRLHEGQPHLPPAPRDVRWAVARIARLAWRGRSDSTVLPQGSSRRRVPSPPAVACLACLIAAGG